MGFILTGRYFVVEREEVDMERYDARKETFEEIEIFDTLALFSSGRIQRESVPKASAVMKCGMMMSVWGSHVK